MLNVGIDKINGIKLLFSHYSASLFLFYFIKSAVFTVCASRAGYQNHLGYNIVKKLSTDCTHEVQFTVRRSDTQSVTTVVYCLLWLCRELSKVPKIS